MVKIALIGASGHAGSCILKELSDRGHVVTAIARNPDKIAPLPGVTPRRADIADRTGLADALAGHDAVISSVLFSTTDPQLLLGAIHDAGVRRYLVVGGAGSLEVAPGKRVIDQPGFPPQFKEESTKGAAYLDLLKAEPTLDWTFLSPSAEFGPGERTGRFRIGKDTLLTGENGSKISFEDFAIALVDELEKPAHSRQRFTVGY